MKKLTEKQRQWAWFAFLWGTGFAVVLVLAYGVRWVMGMA